MQTRGYVNFDGLTKTKTVDKMLLDAPLESLVDVFTLFSELLNRPPTMDENATETARRVLADHLTHLVPTKARLATSEQDGRILKGILGDILKQFTLYAYFDDRSPEQPRPSISEAGRDMFRSRIVSCLRDLMAKNTMTDVEDYPCLILRFIRDLVKDDRRHGISQLFSTQADPVIQSRIADAIDTTLQLYEKMAGSHEKDASYKAFIMLFSLTILQAYNGDPDAVSLLDEIQQSYESLLKQKSREGDAEGSEVLVEIILSLVSRPSLLFRRLAAQVFSAMASRINERGMQSVLAVCNPLLD